MGSRGDRHEEVEQCACLGACRKDEHLLRIPKSAIETSVKESHLHANRVADAAPAKRVTRAQRSQGPMPAEVADRIVVSNTSNTMTGAVDPVQDSAPRKSTVISTSMS